MKRICMVWLLAAVLLLSGGCGAVANKTLPEGSLKVYYTNVQGTRVDWMPYAPSAREPDEQVEELLKQLCAIPDGQNLKVSKPEAVAINSHKQKDGALTLDFGENYWEFIDKAQDVLLRAAYVLTLTQLEQVDTVEFLIGGKPMKDSQGDEIGPLTAEDFIQDTEEEINAYANEQFTVYFAGPDGDSLVQKTVSGIYGTSQAAERIVMDILMQGPEEIDDSLKTAVPEGTRLLNISTADGICYVNLSEQFLQPVPDVVERVVVYSIVNSLCQLEHVDKVQFSINGEANKEIIQDLNLGSPFTFNQELVEKE